MPLRSCSPHAPSCSPTPGIAAPLPVLLPAPCYAQPSPMHRLGAFASSAPPRACLLPGCPLSALGRTRAALLRCPPRLGGCLLRIGRTSDRAPLATQTSPSPL